MGFPDGMGSWASAIVLGFGWQDQVPNLTRISHIIGRMKISNNLNLIITTEISPNIFFNEAKKTLNEYSQSEGNAFDYQIEVRPKIKLRISCMNKKGERHCKLKGVTYLIMKSRILSITKLLNVRV
jgi:hypothetical protein